MNRPACDLSSPLPLIETMPGVYRSDPMTQSLCGVFDELLAPVFAVLDGFPAYLDPATTPEAMLDWLAAWIGLAFDGHVDAQRKRELVMSGVALLPWRGTARAIRAAVNSVFDQPVEILEPAPGEAPVLLVRLVTDTPDGVDLSRLDAIVAAVKPAHLPHRVEAVARDGHRPTANSA
ncbi:phage tail protein [Mycobacterium sp. IS-1496]|nr:phage tail protein [Mycobacterium sp. IS-1496]